MGQEQSNVLNCGLSQKTITGQIQGSQVLRMRKILQQQRNKYQQLNRELNQNSLLQKPKLESKDATETLKQLNMQNLKQFIEHQNILKFSFESFQKSLPKDNGFYENAQISLAYLIQSRYNTKKHFPQEQVIKLLECMIYAMAFLERRYIKHHDIYPTNIYFVNNLFKLANPKFVMSSYSLTFKRQRFSYLSPELIMSLRQSTQNISEYMLYKSDVFSLGMIMLQFCSLKPSSQCYDQENYDIIDINIKQRLLYIKDIYHPKILEAIILMLQYQSEARIGSFQLSRYTHQFSIQYFNKKIISKKSSIEPIQPIPLNQVSSLPNRQLLIQNSPSNKIQNNINICMHPNTLLYQNNNTMQPIMNPVIITRNNLKEPNYLVRNIESTPAPFQINQNIILTQSNTKYLSRIQKKQSKTQQYQNKKNVQQNQIKQITQQIVITSVKKDMKKIQKQEVKRNQLNIQQEHKQKQQTIDQRVKRILQKSKQIR